MVRRDILPDERDLVGLPYVAVLALGVHGARCVEPLFRRWDQAQEEHVRAISEALSAVETLTRCSDAGSRSPFWGPALDALFLAAEAASVADRVDAPASALYAADATAELSDAVVPNHPRGMAAQAVSRSLSSSARAVEELGPGPLRSFLARIATDFVALRQQASVEGWSDETGIPRGVLGP